MSSPNGSGNEQIMQRGKPQIKNVYVRRRYRAAAPHRSQEVENKQVHVTESRKPAGYCDPIVNAGGNASMARFMASLNNTQLLQFVELSAAAAANANSLHLNQEPSQP